MREATWLAGALTYITTLEKKRRETPGLSFVVLADERIRKKIHELNTEEKFAFPTFASALYNVLKEHCNIWPEARLECVSAPARGVRPHLPPSTGDDDVDKIANDRTERRKQQRARKAANLRELKAKVKDYENDKQERQRVRSRTPPRTRDVRDTRRQDVPPRRVPAKEWKELMDVKGNEAAKKACRFWNSSLGCSNDNCNFRPICIKCGGAHRFVDKHMKGR